MPCLGSFWAIVALAWPAASVGTSIAVAPSGKKPAGGPPTIWYRTRRRSQGVWFDCRVTVVVKTCWVPAGLIAGGGNRHWASIQWTTLDLSRAPQL